MTLAQKLAATTLQHITASRSAFVKFVLFDTVLDVAIGFALGFIAAKLF